MNKSLLFEVRSGMIANRFVRFTRSMSANGQRTVPFPSPILAILMAVLTVLIFVTELGAENFADFTFTQVNISHSDRQGETILQEVIPLDYRSRFYLNYTVDPNLDIFFNSFGFFYERDFPSRLLGPKALGSWLGRLKVGLINMPNHIGYQYYEDMVQSDLEKTLLLASFQTGFNYLRDFDLSGRIGPYWGIHDTIFSRLAYNLYDLKPSICSLCEGRTLLQVLAAKNSGLSYSTFCNKATAYTGVKASGNSVELFFSSLITDFLYSDYSLGIRYSSGSIFQVSLAYDWASYDSLNGVSQRAIRAGCTFSQDRGSFSIEGRQSLRSSGTGRTWSLGFHGSFLLDHKQGKVTDRRKFQIDPADQRLTQDTVQQPQPVESAPAKTKYIYAMRLLDEAIEVSWDKTLADRRNLTIPQISSILLVNEIYNMYDYRRIMNINFRDMRSLEEFIEKGGICRDASNATANLLINNGYEAKIVFTKQAVLSPHAFVATRDESGEFYLLDFGFLYRVPGSTNLQEAAASYSQFLTMAFLDPQTHRVTDVFVSKDSEYLETITGMVD